MPVNPIALFENRALLLKIEVTYGTDSVPVVGTNAMLSLEGSVKLLSDKLDRKLDRPFFGSDPFVLIGKRAEVEFDFDLIGHATPGTAPGCSAILTSCGLAETLSPGVSATYVPVSSAFSAATIYFFHAGLLFKVLGARGTISIDMSIKQWPKAHAKYIGLIAAATPTEVAPGALVLTAFQTPPAVETETLSFLAGATPLNITAFTFEVGNELQIYEGSEAREVSIKDRMPAGSFTAFQEVLATFNPWSIANAYTLQDFAVAVNGGAGKITTLNIDFAQLEYPELTDTDGGMSWRIPFVATPSSAGNNEFSIVFT